MIWKGQGEKKDKIYDCLGLQWLTLPQRILVCI